MGSTVVLPDIEAATARNVASVVRNAMSKPSFLVRFPLIALLILAALPHSLRAQQAPAEEDHKAHHPAAGPTSSDGATTPIIAPGPAANMGAMNGMMENDTCEGCGPGSSSPLMSSILTLSPENDAARQALAAESHRRMDQGAALAVQAAKEVQSAASMRDVATVEVARARLREAHALFESGAAAHLALSRGADAPKAALDWFRTQMNLPTANARRDESIWLGATPAHLLLMITLALITASLLGLQLLRRNRIRTILQSAPSPTITKPSVVMPEPSGRPHSLTGGPTVESAREAANQQPKKATSIATAAGERWSGRLRVAQVVRETPTVSTFRLVDPGGDHLPFTFAPGQFLQVEVETPSGPVKRSYTIASSPTQSAYIELTVKREEQGVVSAFLHTHVKVGQLLKVAGPFGIFTFNGTDAESIVLIAGGVGITPMMSVLRYLTDLAWLGDIFFIYSARSPEEVVFREEIEYLERRHPNLHTLVLVDSRTPGTSWLGPEGRLTRELIQNEVPNIGTRRIHLCGPPAMMTAMKELLADLGVPDAQIRSEAFSPASLPSQPLPPGDAEPAKPVTPARSIPLEVAPATVTFSVAGVAAALSDNQTVLEAAEGAGVDIPYSCRSGICGVCVVKLTQGKVTMAVEDGLDPADKAQGYVLACQAKSAGGNIVIEA
jgi:ferredoxin-NADP reductase